MTLQLEKLKQIFSKKNIKKIAIESMQSNASITFAEDLIRLRLSTEGTDIFGNKLKTDIGKIQGTSSGYSLFTQKEKKANFVDLYDTGNMFESINFASKNYGLFSDANFKKAKSNIFDNFKDSFANEKDMKIKIINLSESEKDLLVRNVLINMIIKKINEQIKQI